MGIRKWEVRSQESGKAEWWGGRGFSATMSGFEHLGIPAVFEFLAIAAEFFGGLGLMLGLLGRVAAFGIACVTVVAIAKKASSITCWCWR